MARPDDAAVPPGGHDDAGDVAARVAAIYAGPPASFVGERDGLARELRAAGRRDEASQVKALRKPKTVAWALDSGAALDPAAIAGLVAAVEALRDAQAGGGDVRAAIAGLRAAEGRVAAAAGEAARVHSRGVERATLAAALRAVVGDPGALADLQAGRLADIPGSGRLGAAPTGGAAPPAPTRAPAAGTRRRGADAGAAAAGERPTGAGGTSTRTAEIAAARRAVEVAERAVRAAAGAARTAARAAETAEARARRLQDEAIAMQGRADQALGAAQRARREAQARAAAVDEAEAGLATARIALRALDR